MTFDDFFHTATGNAPYAYQRRLAGAPSTEGSAPSGPFPCEAQLISVQNFSNSKSNQLNS